MMKLRGGTQLSWSGVGFSVVVKAGGGLGRCEIPIYGTFFRLYIVLMPIYGKRQNEQSTHFVSLSVLIQTEFPLAKRLFSSNRTFRQKE